jgi:hypothetical protein
MCATAHSDKFSRLRTADSRGEVDRNRMKTISNFNDDYESFVGTSCPAVSHVSSKLEWSRSFDD